MVGLQEAQVESMRRLTAGLTDAIGEAQLTLQVRSVLVLALPTVATCFSCWCSQQHLSAPQPIPQDLQLIC